MVLKYPEYPKLKFFWRALFYIPANNQRKLLRSQWTKSKFVVFTDPKWKGLLAAWICICNRCLTFSYVSSYFIVIRRIYVVMIRSPRFALELLGSFQSTGRFHFPTQATLSRKCFPPFRIFTTREKKSVIEKWRLLFAVLQHIKINGCLKNSAAPEKCETLSFIFLSFSKCWHAAKQAKPIDG